MFTVLTNFYQMQVMKVLDSFSDPGFLESKVYCAIKSELIIRKETLLYEIIKKWQELISWSTGALKNYYSKIFFLLKKIVAILHLNLKYRVYILNNF